MNSDGIKRSVRANRHERAAGDAPSMGRVSRMPGTGLPKGSRRQRKKDEYRRGNRVRNGRLRVIQTWSITLSAVVLVILGLSVWLWFIPKMNSAGKVAVQSPSHPGVVARASSKFPPPSQAEAVAIVKQALAIRDPEKIPELFRPGTASPQEIVGFLASMESTDGALGHLEWRGSMDANGLEINGVLIYFAAPDKPRNRLAMLTPDPAGKWQIDFDTLARTVKPSWPELLEPRTEGGRVRVYVASDSYYNGPFQDDQQWVCYGIASPDTDQILLAYAKAGSAQAAAMKWIVSKDSPMTRATLEIRRVAGGESRQFEISQVLAEDWVEVTEPFDQRFR